MSEGWSGGNEGRTKTHNDDRRASVILVNVDDQRHDGDDNYEGGSGHDPGEADGAEVEAVRAPAGRSPVTFVVPRVLLLLIRVSVRLLLVGAGLGDRLVNLDGREVADEVASWTFGCHKLGITSLLRDFSL